MFLPLNSRFLPQLACLSLLMLACGCSSGKTPMKQDFPPWPELQQLQSTEIMMPIDTSFASNNTAGFTKALQSPAFATAVDKFAAATIPSGYDDPARKQAQEDVVARYRKCIALAKSGASADELKKTYASAKEAMSKVGQAREKAP